MCVCVCGGGGGGLVYCVYLLRMHVLKNMIYILLEILQFSFTTFYISALNMTQYIIRFSHKIHILQKYVNVCFQYLVWLHFAAVTAGKADQSCTTSCRNFSSFLSTKPLVMWFLKTPCFRSFHNNSVGLWFRHWLGRSKTLPLFFFNHSLIKRLVCLCSCLAAWHTFP